MYICQEVLIYYLHQVVPQRVHHVDTEETRVYTAVLRNK